MKKILRLCAVFLFVSASPLHAETLTLADACERALNYDAKLKVAEAGNAVQKEEVGKARANFRPTLRISAARGRNATESTSLITDTSKDAFYNTQNYSVVLRQPLFNMSNYAAYRQSKAIALKSDAKLHKEHSELFVRTLESYVNVLFSEDNLDFSRTQVDAAKEQLQQAKRRFAAGYGTVTEINEAQANYDMVLAQGLEHNHNLENRRRELETITGIYPQTLLKLDAGRMKLVVPEPHNVQHWVDLALEENPELDAANQEIRIARELVDKNRAVRYPTVDLVASRTFSESDNNYSIGNQYDTYSLNVQMSMPIYSGGYVSASVRQSSAQFRQAHEQRSLTERTISANVRQYFNGILNSIAQIKAYEQAVTSNDIALTGTRKGFTNGFRSNVDVLNAMAKLFDSKRNLAKARYQYIMNITMLKHVAGILTPQDIAEINSWMK
ncbi:MAG: TolC family outer membrane protein [Chlorobiaceae bacterium]|nr:TolC family outer membrane protein [Chlorobiaceae bacterium]